MSRVDPIPEISKPDFGPKFWGILHEHFEQVQSKWEVWYWQENPKVQRICSLKPLINATKLIIHLKATESACHILSQIPEQEGQGVIMWLGVGSWYLRVCLGTGLD